MDEKKKGGIEKKDVAVAKNLEKNKPEAKKQNKKPMFSRIASVVKKEKQQAAPDKSAPAGDPYDIIKFVLMTEKAVRQIETQNRLVFIVDMDAKKGTIRSAVESAFNSPVTGVNTMIDQAGRKKASVKFGKEGAAGEIAIRLGIL